MSKYSPMNGASIPRSSSESESGTGKIQDVSEHLVMTEIKIRAHARLRACPKSAGGDLLQSWSSLHNRTDNNTTELYL